MRFEERLGRWLRKSSQRAVPQDLDHRVRVALRTLPLARVRPFESVTTALGLAVAATLAMTVNLAIVFASSGAGEAGIAIAAAMVVGYLGLASVVALPLLIKLRLSRRRPEVRS